MIDDPVSGDDVVWWTELPAPQSPLDQEVVKLNLSSVLLSLSPGYQETDQDIVPSFCSQKQNTLNNFPCTDVSLSHSCMTTKSQNFILPEILLF